MGALLGTIAQLRLEMKACASVSPGPALGGALVLRGPAPCIYKMKGSALLCGGAPLTQLGSPPP